MSSTKRREVPLSCILDLGRCADQRDDRLMAELRLEIINAFIDSYSVNRISCTGYNPSIFCTAHLIQCHLRWVAAPSYQSITRLLPVLFALVETKLEMRFSILNESINLNPGQSCDRQN